MLFHTDLTETVLPISPVIRWCFFFQNNPKDPDTSCKMDLVL